MMEKKNLPEQQPSENAAPADCAPAACAPADEKTQKQKPAKPPKQPVRRVGTLTMGLALIAAGCVALAALFVPGFDFVLAAKLSPLILVFLGGEVLWFSLHPGSQRIKFDFLSVLTCFVLICVSMAVLLVPPALEIGTRYSQTRSRLEREIVEQTYDSLHELGVVSASCWVDLDWTAFDPDMQAEDLGPGQLQSMNVYLGGSFSSRTAFVMQAAKVIDALKAQNVCPNFLSINSESPEHGNYAISLEGPYIWGWQPEELEHYVEHWGGEEVFPAESGQTGDVGPDVTVESTPML